MECNWNRLEELDRGYNEGRLTWRQSNGNKFDESQTRANTDKDRGKDKGTGKGR